MLVKSSSIFLGLLVLCGAIKASFVATDLKNGTKRPIVFFVQKEKELVACQASDSQVGTSTIQELEKKCSFTDSCQLHKHENPELYDPNKKPSAEAALN